LEEINEKIWNSIKNEIRHDRVDKKINSFKEKNFSGTYRL